MSPFDRMTVVLGDITQLPVDAIVNAANSSLRGGGGVDGAIHRAAGPQLLEACKLLHGCETGHAKITPGFDLSAKFVIHAVGPVYCGGFDGEAVALRSCYTESLRLAAEAGAESIAFPCISTGVYEYPKEAACKVAVEAVSEWLSAHSLPKRVTFCCFDSASAGFYRAKLAAGTPPVG